MPTGAIAPTGRMHWVGTGLSTGSGLRVLGDLASQLMVWGRTEQRAKNRLADLGVTHAEARQFDPSALAGEVAPGDVVVSMLPTAEHPALLRICLDRGAHFACSSYVSDALAALAPAAAERGIVLLAEAGLDPGIDHLLAHDLVNRATVAVGGATPASAVFTSYCGGIPAVANEFRYRFTWAPIGVLTALRAPARFISKGTERTVDHPWEATQPHDIGAETFEVYPNRDSVPFVEQYGFPKEWRLDTFVRGTLRLAGWRQAWDPVFAELRAGDEDRISALAGELAARYPTTEADRDRVVLAVTLRVRGDDGVAWSGWYVLDVLGDEAESAMARCVSTSLACGVHEIVAGNSLPGLHRAAERNGEVRRWLGFLAEHRLTPACYAGSHMS